MKDGALVTALASDFRRAPLTDRQLAMLLYADKLTREPWAMQAEDVEALRRAGFADRDVLDIAQVTGYYAFVNRLADGLGVELESYWTAADGRPG